MTEDPDTLRDQWHDVQANDAHLEYRQTINWLAGHRCPPGMEQTSERQPMSDEAERYKRIADECLGAFDSAKVLTTDEKDRELLRENADLRLALAELLRLSAPPYERTMGEYAEWCAAIVMDRIRELDAENIELRATLTELADWLDQKLVGPYGRRDAGGWRVDLGAKIDAIRARPNHHPMSSVDCRP